MAGLQPGRRSTQQDRLYRLRKKPSFCHSERSEESLLGILFSH
jgi:hypothetical protein